MYVMGRPIFWHPLLTVPVCQRCSDTYHSGEFTIDTTHEVYCRWCGDGGNIFCCDTCDKSFCESKTDGFVFNIVA